MDSSSATRVEGLGRVRSSVTCHGASLDISCKDGQQALIIYKASYGRSRLGVCPYKNKQGVPENDTDDFSLCEREVTDNIKDLCGWHKRCNITVNSEALGEVCPGVYKYLTVLYSCGKIISSLRCRRGRGGKGGKVGGPFPFLSRFALTNNFSPIPSPFHASQSG